MTAPQKIFGGMAAILAEVNAIGKNSKNVSQGFNYRGIDDVYNTINPLLAAHNIFMTAEVVEKSREERTNKNGTVLAFTCLRMRYRFYADDGSFVTTEAEGEGMDSGDKSSNKAMAIAHKYALLQAFCVPTKGLDDPDAESPQIDQAKSEATPSAPSSDRATKAKQWGEGAIGLVNRTGDSAKFKAWHEKNLQVIANLKDIHPDIHKRLIAAIDGRLSAFSNARAA